MHAIAFVELAAAFVRHSETQISLRQPATRQHVQALWMTSRFRHDAWSARLATHRTAIQRPGVSFRQRRWREIMPVIQEVLLTEPLTRCIAHHATLLEELQIDKDFAALAHSSLNAHIEARHRCLSLIVFGSGLATEWAVRLNRLRRLCESYTDQLLASMRPTKQVDLCSFDSPAMGGMRRTFQEQCYSDWCRRLHNCSLVRAFLESADFDLDRRSAQGKHNQQVAESVLGLLPRELFDAFGVPMSKRLAVLQRGSAEPARHPQSSLAILNSPLDLLGRPPSRGTSSTQSAKRRWE